MIKRRATLEDIAKHLNLSKATVSNAISGKRHTSAKTVEKVKAAAKKLGYRTNIIAQSLRTKSLNLVGVTVPDITEPYQAILVRKIEQELKKYGVEILLGSYYFDTDEERRIVDTFQKLMVRGILSVTGLSDTNEVYERASLEMPIVFINRDPGDCRIPAVLNDNRRMSFDAVDYLVSKGHRRIAHLTIPFENFITLKLRAEGYVEALERRGIEYDPDMLIIDNKIRLHEIETSLHLADRIKKMNVSALYVVSDYVAVGLIKGLVNVGMTIPRDISILSTNNTDYCLVTSPTISSIDLTPGLMVRKAVEMLLTGETENEKPKKVFIPHKICERGSS